MPKPQFKVELPIPKSILLTTLLEALLLLELSLRLLLPTLEELLMKCRYWKGFEILMCLFSDDVGSELKIKVVNWKQATGGVCVCVCMCMYVCVCRCVCMCVCACVHMRTRTVRPVKTPAGWSNYKGYPRIYPIRAPQSHMDLAALASTTFLLSRRGMCWPAARIILTVPAPPDS